MPKKPTAKQLEARKKFVAAVRAGKFSKKKRSVKKRTAKKRVRSVTAVRVTRVRVRTAKKRSAPKKTTVASLKSRIRVKLDDQLKDLLFRRDKAKTYRQHRTAQLQIDKVRKELRKIS